MIQFNLYYESRSETQYYKICGDSPSSEHNWPLSRIVNNFTFLSMIYITTSVFWVSLPGLPKTLEIWKQGCP